MSDLNCSFEPEKNECGDYRVDRWLGKHKSEGNGQEKKYGGFEAGKARLLVVLKVAR